MGWTGMFDWNRNEKNHEILNREFFGVGGNVKLQPLAWSDKGGHTWLLYEDKVTHKKYSSVILTKRCRDEFMYKEISIDCHPYQYDIPSSWVEQIASSYADSELFRGWLAEYKKSKTKKVKTDKVFDFGSIIKCRATSNICWGNGNKICKGDEFYVAVEVLNPYAKRKTKSFNVLSVHETEGKDRETLLKYISWYGSFYKGMSEEDSLSLVKKEGKIFSRTQYRISSPSMKTIEVVEKVR